MNRKMLTILMTLLLALGLCACGGDEPEVSSSGSGPGRMVRRIEVSILPEDPDLCRTYVTQENMNELLTLLRAMQTDEEPEQEPDINGGQSCYTATVTFANGEQSVYYLLGHTYLRLGDEPWCIIDTELSRQFSEFLHTRPSDDGSVTIETTEVPTQTTVPPTTE